MNLLSKFREKKYDLFNKKTKGTIYSDTIYTNDYINIVSDACAISHGASIDKSIDAKKKYIEKIAGMGHESIIEHSNVIQMYKFHERYAKELAEFLDAKRYLNSKLEICDNTMYLLLGGSIRGYKEIVKNMSNFDNPIFQKFLYRLYDLDSCFFSDFINDGILDKSMFKSLDFTMKTESIQRELYDITSLDKNSRIAGKIADDYDVLFDIEDILKMTSITILIKDVSRIISQQFTRHRCGITQASQRYIDASNEKFNSPANFKPNLYDKNTIYNIKFGNNTYGLTLQDLGDLLLAVYPQLKNQGLLKEDARGYLPNNTTSSLYMTFPQYNFIKFLQLRTDKGAQAEIRQIAQGLEIDFLQSTNLSNIYTLLEPKYKKFPKNYGEIDEVIYTQDEDATEEIEERIKADDGTRYSLDEIGEKYDLK